jgi:hypothetical protein
VRSSGIVASSDPFRRQNSALVGRRHVLTTSFKGFYGHGIVDALAAVTRDDEDEQ